MHRKSHNERFETAGTGSSIQAVGLVRALRHQLHHMTTQLAWVERQDVTGRNGRACALRLEAAKLSRDIKEAQALIDRLKRRYPVTWHDIDGRLAVRRRRAVSAEPALERFGQR